MLPNCPRVVSACRPGLIRLALRDPIDNPTVVRAAKEARAERRLEVVPTVAQGDKLSAEDKAKIRKRTAAGEKAKDIANEFGVPAARIIVQQVGGQNDL